ncbi:MAG: hypothetical protein WCG99_04095 [Candidatus Berkelbacteria bacterium]
MKRKIRVKTRLKLFRNGKLVLDCTKRKNSQILLQLEHVPHDKSYVRVDYPGVGWNDSFHENDESLKMALSSYLEKSLLDFAGIKGESK